MPDIEIINPGTPVVGPYNPGIKIGNLLFVSGQGSAQIGANIKVQSLDALNNIKKVIEAAGGKISNIVNTTVFLKNMQEFSEMNGAYKRFFNDNGVTEFYPARTTVEISNLPLAGMLIEINAIVAL